jgi:hypothetical protein
MTIGSLPVGWGMATSPKFLEIPVQDPKTTEAPAAEIDDSDFPRERAKFYELIGHCVTLYQSLEDHLPSLFAAAVGGSSERAKAIFAAYRGLEAKLDGITAAVSDADQESKETWERLRPLIKSASEARGKIAHASVLHRGGGVALTLNSQMQAVHARRIGKSKMELRKTQKTGEAVWDNDALFEEYGRTEKAMRLSIGLAKHLRGEAVPSHLRE